MSSMIKELEKEMNEIITRIIRGLNDELQAAEDYIASAPISQAGLRYLASMRSDLEAMIEAMEDFDTQSVFNIPTNSWNERQIIMSHIMNAGLIPEVRDPLFQRAEHALSKAGV
jgi:hypothetical protein